MAGSCQIGVCPFPWHAAGVSLLQKLTEMKGKKRQPNYMQLAMDVLRGRWMLYGAERLLPHALDFLARVPGGMLAAEYEPMLYSGDGAVVPEDEPERKQNKVMVIPLHGPLTKYWSCGTVSTMDVASDMLVYAAREDIVGFVLDIDSPGGAVNAVAPMTAAVGRIRSMGKPVVVHCDLCASAAYWIASQCDVIFMDNMTSAVGSIGAYVSYLDDRENRQTGERFIDVYALESPDKNKAYREALEGRYEVCQAELSELVGMFHEAVKGGRPDLKADADGVLTGALFHQDKAVPLGLADGMKSLSECIENVFIRAEFNN